MSSSEDIHCHLGHNNGLFFLMEEMHMRAYKREKQWVTRDTSKRCKEAVTHTLQKRRSDQEL